MDIYSIVVIAILIGFGAMQTYRLRQAYHRLDHVYILPSGLPLLQNSAAMIVKTLDSSTTSTTFRKFQSGLKQMRAKYPDHPDWQLCLALELAVAERRQ